MELNKDQQASFDRVQKLKAEILSKKNMKADIASGEIGSDASYDVQFVGMKLTASITEKKWGISDQFGIDAEAVLAALFAKLPAGTITQEIEKVITAGLQQIA